MSTRPLSLSTLFLATLFASAVLPQGFEVAAAENVHPEAPSHAMQARMPALNRLPDLPLAALAAATQVARIDHAFRATNEPSRVRTQTGATAKKVIARVRPVAIPTAAAIAVVNAAEPRPAAPAMKPFNDSLVVTASYAAPIPSSAASTTEPAPSSDNPLRHPIAASTALHAANPGTSTPRTNNPLR